MHKAAAKGITGGARHTQVLEAVTSRWRVHDQHVPAWPLGVFVSLSFLVPDLAHSHQLFESRRRGNKVLVEPALKDRAQQAFDRDNEPQILLESSLAAGGQDKERRRDLPGDVRALAQGGKSEQTGGSDVLVEFDQERLFPPP